MNERERKTKDAFNAKIEAERKRVSQMVRDANAQNHDEKEKAGTPEGYDQSTIVPRTESMKKLELTDEEWTFLKLVWWKRSIKGFWTEEHESLGFSIRQKLGPVTDDERAEARRIR
jgi:hypothetical protein